MLTRLMITTAIGALMATGVLAQSNPPVTSPAPGASTSNGGDSTAGGGSFVTQQGATQLLASKFRGSDVVGPDNQKIGDVSDILFDQSGRIDAYVVSVGGFLGVGSKEVAMVPSSFQVMNENNTIKLKTAMTKDQLKQAANFQPKQEKPTTTGSSSSSGGSPAMGGRPGTPRQ